MAPASLPGLTETTGGPADGSTAGATAPAVGGRTSLEDVCAVLWPAPASASLARGRAGHPEKRDLLVLPSARKPRLLVPSARRAGAAAVRRYGEPGSVRAWAGSRVLALALAGGAGAFGLGGRLRVRAAPGTDTIEEYLRTALGRDVLISTHLGAARANRKPVLQLLTAQGETAGFAKISVNSLTRDLIRSERDALDLLATENFRNLTVPRVLHHGQWQGREVLIMDALPVWRPRKALRPGQLDAAMTELSEVGGRRRGPLAGGAYLTRLRSRLEALPASPDRATLGIAIEAAARTGAELTWGAWHGDWTGWNMACTAGGLLIWDWERFAPDVPAGFDALHYRLQSAVVRQGQAPAAAAAECLRTAAGALAPFGIPADEAHLVGVLYLAELSVRYLADRQAEAGARLGRPGTWLIPAIEEGVRTL